MKKKEKQSFLHAKSDMLVSVITSFPLSLMIIGLYYALSQRLGTEISVVFLGLIMILILPLISAIISFRVRSLKLPLYTFIGTSLLSNVIYVVVFPSSGNVASTIGRLSVALFLTLFFGFFVMLPSISLTRLLIGIPRVDDPYRISLDLPKISLAEIHETLSWIMGTHFMFGGFNNKNSRYGKFSTQGSDITEADPKYLSNIEITENENNLTLKLLIYSKQSIFTKIVRNQLVENLGSAIQTSIMSKISNTSLSNDKNFDVLYDHALGYTKNRFQEKFSHLIQTIQINGTIFVFVGITATAIFLYLIKPEYGTPIVVIATIIAAVVAVYQLIISREKKSHIPTFDK